MVEGTALEMRHGGNLIVSSNLTVSAGKSRKGFLSVRFEGKRGRENGSFPVVEAGGAVGTAWFQSAVLSLPKGEQ